MRRVSDERTSAQEAKGVPGWVWLPNQLLEAQPGQDPADAGDQQAGVDGAGQGLEPAGEFAAHFDGATDGVLGRVVGSWNRIVAGDQTPQCITALVSPLIAGQASPVLQ